MGFPACAQASCHGRARTRAAFLFALRQRLPWGSALFPGLPPVFAPSEIIDTARGWLRLDAPGGGPC